VSDHLPPAAVLLPRTKAGVGYGWGRDAMEQARKAFGVDAVNAASILGRIAKAIDDDVQLLYLAGIKLDRMEMQHCDDARRHRLMVDGQVVREYTVTFAVDGEAVRR
jgi:hypothetical protein